MDIHTRAWWAFNDPNDVAAWMKMNI